MFGRTVEIAGIKVFVTCNPSTPLHEVVRRASEKMEQWEAASDHKQHSRQIADKYGISFAH